MEAAILKAKEGKSSKPLVISYGDDLDRVLAATMALWGPVLTLLVTGLQMLAEYFHTRKMVADELVSIQTTFTPALLTAHKAHNWTPPTRPESPFCCARGSRFPA